MASEDRKLLERAMADVARIPQDRHLPAPVRREPIPLSQREAEVLRELDELVTGSDPVEIADADDRIEGRVPGLDPRVMGQLRRGEFTVQADLDLHGEGAENARVRVESFITETHARGLRCVRIVHGKGRNSPGHIPVLKSRLPRWLGRGPARQRVLAYTSAQPYDGGAGAVYVLLRGRGQGGVR